MAKKGEQRAPWIKRNDGDIWIRKDNQGIEHEYQKVDGVTIRLRRVTPYQEKHKQKKAHIKGLNEQSQSYTGIKKEFNPLTHKKVMVKIDNKTYKEIIVPIHNTNPSNE